MNAATRLDTLERLAREKRLIAISSVDQLDLWLRQEFGIVPVSSLDDWQCCVAASGISDTLYDKFYALYDKRIHELEQTNEMSSSLDAEFYELIAQDPLAGLVHSQKRSVILDAAAFLQSLLKHLEVQGRVLDVGCHVGYHAIWLSSQSKVTVVGVDVSSAATAYARKKASLLGANASFVTGDVVSVDFEQSFDLIYAVDSLPVSPKEFSDVVDHLSRTLVPGGCMVVFGSTLHETICSPEVHACLNRNVLGFGIGDIVGGATVDGDFAVKQTVVLVKGVENSVPEAILGKITSAWGEFSKYANRSEIAIERKTQAFHRCWLNMRRELGHKRSGRDAKARPNENVHSKPRNATASEGSHMKLRFD